MSSPGGYHVSPGLYRVPDLLTEDQMVAYMRDTYGRTIEFTDDETHSAARALGRTYPVGTVNEEDMDKLVPEKVNDPVLRSINERNFYPSLQDTNSTDNTDSTEENKVPADAPKLPTETSKTTSSTSTAKKPTGTTK